ncbi:MAG: ribose-5-phosphate isomerase RpiA [Candidatus Dasytiphilus stammeri]
MNNEDLKKNVAIAALKYIQQDAIIGIGSGSTINYFIKALETIKYKIKGAVSSSQDTSFKLKQCGIPLINSNHIDSLSLYIDSADEINDRLQMIKGKGGALTKEKIIAAISKHFLCIADESKYVNLLGKTAPIPLEVIPMARAYVARQIVKLLGALPKYRSGVITENGNVIIDIYNASLIEPIEIEKKLSLIVGVITVGLFTIRTADTALIATNSGGIKFLTKPLSHFR